MDRAPNSPKKGDSVSPKSDVVDSLLAPDDDPQEQADAKLLACMVVHARAASSAEIDEHERAMREFDKTQIFPMPFWNDDDSLELTTENLAMLAAIGVSPLEYEIILLEEKMEVRHGQI